MSRIIAALPNEGKDALVALFEIGADTTSLKVLRDDEMLYDRDQAFGGSQLTQLISRQYGFSFEEAEQKKLAGDLPEDYESAILAPFVDSLSQEIGRALQYFFTSTPHHKVHYVMLAGGTAALPDLKERVTELTGFASHGGQPVRGDEARLARCVKARCGGRPRRTSRPAGWRCGGSCSDPDQPPSRTGKSGASAARRPSSPASASPPSSALAVAGIWYSISST